jgi:putative copper resistance protein D
VLLVKVTLVLIMLGLAATNRWVLWPKINAERRAGEGGGAMAALHRSVAVELAAGGFVLLAVSLLGILPPGVAAMPGH